MELSPSGPVLVESPDGNSWFHSSLELVKYEELVKLCSQQMSYQIFDSQAFLDLYRHQQGNQLQTRLLLGLTGSTWVSFTEAGTDPSEGGDGNRYENQSTKSLIESLGM